jgi:hypothetical protein
MQHDQRLRSAISCILTIPCTLLQFLRDFETDAASMSQLSRVESSQRFNATKKVRLHPN